jgi:hypothetical protein
MASTPDQSVDHVVHEPLRDPVRLPPDAFFAEAEPPGDGVVAVDVPADEAGRQGAVHPDDATKAVAGGELAAPPS